MGSVKIWWSMLLQFSVTQIEFTGQQQLVQPQRKTADRWRIFILMHARPVTQTAHAYTSDIVLKAVLHRG